MLVPKIIKNNVYITPSNSLARAVVVHQLQNKAVMYDYGSCRNEDFDIDFLQRAYQPAFLIGEVGRTLNRSPATIRKYEQLGKISPARQFKVGRKNMVRAYVIDDIIALREFFSTQRVRRPPGRGTLAEADVAEAMSNLYKRRFERSSK